MVSVACFFRISLFCLSLLLFSNFSGVVGFRAIRLLLNSFVHLFIRIRQVATQHQRRRQRQRQQHRLQRPRRRSRHWSVTSPRHVTLCGDWTRGSRSWAATSVRCPPTYERCCAPFTPFCTRTTTGQDLPRRRRRRRLGTVLRKLPRRRCRANPSRHQRRRRGLILLRTDLGSRGKVRRKLPHSCPKLNRRRRRDLRRRRRVGSKCRQDLPRRFWHRGNAARWRTLLRRRTRNRRDFVGRRSTIWRGLRVLRGLPFRWADGACREAGADRRAAIASGWTTPTPPRWPVSAPNRRMRSPTADHPRSAVRGLDGQRWPETGSPPRWSCWLPPRPRPVEQVGRGRGRWFRPTTSPAVQRL